MDPKSPAGPSRPLQPQPQLVQALGKGGPQPTNTAAAAAGNPGLVAQMPDLDLLHLGLSPARNFSLRPELAQLPGDGVKEPVVPAPPGAFVLVNLVAGHTPDWLDGSDFVRSLDNR